MSRRIISVNREKLFTDEEKQEKKERIFEQLSEFLNEEVKLYFKNTQNIDRNFVQFCLIV